jgi:hypothetical protein
MSSIRGHYEPSLWQTPSIISLSLEGRGLG